MPVALPALGALALGTALAARVRAGKRAGLAVTHHRIPWKTDRAVRVAHLTDIHVGPTTPWQTLECVAEVVAASGCDVVVLTGDYVNASVVHVGRVTDLVRLLPSPCVAVLGNHDHWTSAERVTRALEAGGARVLRNESLTVGGSDWSLEIVGVDDGRSNHDDVDRAFRDVVAPERVLALTHDPRTAPRIAKTGAPLVLAGHTHAGQIDVAGLMPSVARLAGHPYLRGFHEFDRTHLYVSAGIGHSLHGLRSAGTAPEVALFDLDPSVCQRSSRLVRTALP